jgi:3-deoxy-manno-octulosonate cytidylyltransferase (CMP-KDO synthetase)
MSGKPQSSQAGVKGLLAIPARIGSTRLSNKPLRLINGKSLLEHVHERAREISSISEIVVATDSGQIKTLAESFGAKVVMTEESISCGSERAARVLELIPGNWDFVVNLQGDLPFIKPAIVEAAIDLLLNCDFGMTTVGVPIFDQAEYLSNTAVKAVVGTENRALYFTRAPAPHSRDGTRQLWNGREIFGVKHLGLYVYRPAVLKLYRQYSVSTLEKIEMLEQLRLLEHGVSIGISVLDPALTENSVEVDTEADLKRAEEIALLEKGLRG